MRHLLLILLLTAGRASSQPAIGPPPAGFIRDFEHSVRPVIGIPGNFLLGDSIGEGVISFAFSGVTGLLKTDSSLQVLDRLGQTTYARDAAAGPALFAFAVDGAPAYTYVVSTRAILIWRTDHFDAVQWEIGGTVVAIANPAAGVLAAIVEREDGPWEMTFDVSTGNLLSQTYATADLESPDTIVEQMDKSWVHVMEPGSHKHYAVQSEPGRTRRYQLPETQP